MVDRPDIFLLAQIGGGDSEDVITIYVLSYAELKRLPVSTDVGQLASVRVAQVSGVTRLDRSAWIGYELTVKFDNSPVKSQAEVKSHH